MLARDGGREDERGDLHSAFRPPAVGTHGGGRPPRLLTRVARSAGACAAALAGLVGGCTPPWYRFSTVEVEGRLLAEGRCEAEVRGDVARSLALPVTASSVVGDNLPEPLPPTTFIVTCGARGPAPDASRLQFFIAVRRAAPSTASAAAPGVYEVVGDDAPAAVRARPGVAVFFAALVPDPADQFTLRRYRATGGTLTLASVEPTDGGNHARVTGHFQVRARRYAARLGE